ncbi:hypothetical protein BH23GEM5_BH23GEM5_16900 [soil metagenome]
MMQQWNTPAQMVAFLAFVSAFGCTTSKAEFPKGTYSSVSTSHEHWDVVFADQSRFHVTRDGRIGVEGQYVSTANRVVFSNEKGPDGCGNETGTYNWRRNGDTLRLTAVQEPCVGRRNVMQRLVARK